MEAMEKAKMDGWVDLHSHVLPEMDDGCKNCEESGIVLAQSLEQGIQGIAATPHYYPIETVEQFLKRRQQSYESLLKYIKKNNLRTPRICLGAEVAYRTGISHEPSLKKLCYGSSEYLLFELPFQKWKPSVLQEIYVIRNTRGIIPVIAHVERYMKFQDRKTLSELFDMDIVIQMNAEYLLHGWLERRKAFRMIRNKKIQILSSDCHNIEKRPPNLESGIQQLQKAGLDDHIEELRLEGIEIFQKAFQNEYA